MADHTTPADLERELGIDQKRIRHYLRQRYGNLPAYTDNWHLNQRAAEDVRLHFHAESAAFLASGALLPAVTEPDPGATLFRDATGSTTFDAEGNLVYLPSAEELRDELRRRPVGE
ncbi:hypothetical protein [Amnibacterium kyonggiense]